MHVGAVLVFEAGPLELRHGGIDIERVRSYTAGRLARAPRASQRSIELAFGRLPVWVDDPFFDLAYHVRHVALPRPGDERQLKRLAARIFSQALDPEKPPWELWVVEGLDEDRYALIAKVDAALLDGPDGFDPIESLLQSVPDEAIDAAHRVESRPTPGRIALMRNELARRARDVARPEDVGAVLGHGLRSAVNALERTLSPRFELPLSGPSGSHRRFEWLPIDEADLKRLGERLGASTHAVLLAAISGALRVFLARRGLELDAPGLRVLTPMGVGPETDAVEAPRILLPLFEPDPLLRLDALREAPEPPLRAVARWSLLRDLAAQHGAAASGRPSSLVVSALHAPHAPLFLLGSALRACVAVAPLLSGHTLALTATFFDGRAMLGFSGDAALASDLALLADAMASSFDELRRAASGSVHPRAPGADHARMRNFEAEA